MKHTTYIHKVYFLIGIFFLTVLSTTHSMVVLTTAQVVTPATIALTKIVAGVSIVSGCIYSFLWEAPELLVQIPSSSLGSGGNERCWCGHICDISCTCLCGCICSSRDRRQQRERGYTYQNGVYQDADYHHANSTGNSNGGKSPAPKNGQKALDNSIQIKTTSPKRISLCDGQFVVLCQTREGIYHGYVSTWDELEAEAKSTLIKNGFVDCKGRIENV